jgi:FAD/FMN-containing dehydrogenase
MSLAAGVSIGAHRLDEYLQATLVGIDANRVSLEIDLTPGVSIAKQVTGWIDTNGDGQLSQREGLTYAGEVLASLAVTVDRKPVALTLSDVRLPEIVDMADGVGTIRLRASAALPKATGGRHEITVVNTHRREVSVYLSNALVPFDSRIQILTQQRDRDQHSLTIGYDIETMGVLRRISWIAGALALLGMTALIRRRFGRFGPRQAVRV